MLHRFIQAITRSLAFVRKEIFEILRQPRLLFTLVLGPFLILLIFGIGYRNVARALRTLFVVQEGSPLREQIEEQGTTLGEQLIYAGVTANEAEALQRLRRGEVDVVVVTPPNAYETIRSSEQAVFTLYHHEIDPFQVDYVNYFGQVYIDEVNRRVLLSITQEGQQEASTVQDDLSEARASAAAMRTALEAGDELAARQSRAELSQNVDEVSLAMGATLGVLGGVQQNLGGTEDGGANEILTALSEIQQSTDELNENGNSPGNNSQRIQQVAAIEEELARLEEQLSEFTNIDANVLVRPFRSEASSIAALQPTAETFFAPAVIALLLQHLAITFAALSIVRERIVGTMELFRVSPLSAGETLTGKYISYLIFGGVIAAALTLLLVYGLGVPMLGSWVNYALVVAALLFTSLGIGFFISLVSQSDTQAVQYSMIVLLASVFFSGFLMPLEQLIQPVRVVSWALPTTYGIILLRDIALRGIPPGLILLGGLALIGVVLALVNWILLRRMITAR